MTPARAAAERNIRNAAGLKFLRIRVPVTEKSEKIRYLRRKCRMAAFRRSDSGNRFFDRINKIFRIKVDIDPPAIFTGGSAADEGP